MDINKELTSALEKCNLGNPNTTMAFLLCNYFNIDVQFKHDIKDDLLELSKRNIISRDITKSPFGITLNIPLFKEKIHEVKQEFIDEYRELFKGIRIKSMGNRQDCIEKMKRFRETYPQYSEEDIIKATKYYISHTDPRFTRYANYFIFKRENGIELSDLLTILEEGQWKNQVDWNEDAI